MLTLGSFASFLLSSADFLKENTFSKKIFQEHHQRVKQLDPVQSRPNVGPDLGPNCLQRLSAACKELNK